MKIGNLETTCQGSQGIYFGHYDVYKVDAGYLAYNLETGIELEFYSLELMYNCFNDDSSVVSTTYNPELKDS